MLMITYWGGNWTRSKEDISVYYTKMRLKNMYDGTVTCIRTTGGETSTFSATIGSH